VAQNKLTRKGLANAVYAHSGFEYEEVKTMLNLILDEVSAALLSGRTVELRGFGTFEIRRRKGRKGAWNPKTAESVTTQPHSIVAFRPGRDLKAGVWGLAREEDAPGDAENA